MKTSKFITGCALAAGLMAFAPQSQAGVVIGNEMYAPASIKMTYSYVDNKGKVKKVSLSNKDILFSIWSYAKGSQLAYGPGNDIYVIRNGVVLDDLTYEGYLYVETTPYSQNTTYGKAGSYDTYATKDVETGTVSVDFYSDGGFTYAFGDNYYDFQVSGTYTFKRSQSAENKNYEYNVSGSFTTSNLTGVGDDYDLSGGYYYYYPVTGTASASGSGKLVD